MQNQFYPLVIVGSGIAGLSAAMTAEELGIRTLVISKEDLAQGNSRYAQGGIIFADSEDQTLMQDFLRASSGTADPKMIDLIRTESGSILRHLLLDLAHIDFERDNAGHLLKTKEGAHSIARILFKGDYSGRAIVEGMVDFLSRKAKHVTYATHARVFNLSKNGNSIECIHYYDSANKVACSVRCSKLILASGGCAGLYLNTSNYPGAIGEGMGVAIAMGAKVKDLEFIQFHPTTLYLAHSSLRFLLTEALRGEGALLRNINGERFMPNYHPEAELASRDKVSLAIVEEMRKTNHPCVYLDVSCFDQAHFKQRFPTIAKTLAERGIDPFDRGIPVVPSAHFTCGGVQTDEWGIVPGFDNFYAVGEVACTGLHGANRLASSALLEGLMMGSRSVHHLSKSSFFEPTEFRGEVYVSEESFDEQEHQLQLAKLLWQYVGIERTENDLLLAQSTIAQWLSEIDSGLSIQQLMWRNILLVAYQITKLSLARTQSIGCFLKR